MNQLGFFHLFVTVFSVVKACHGLYHIREKTRLPVGVYVLWTNEKYRLHFSYQYIKELMISRFIEESRLLLLEKQILGGFSQ